MDFTYGKTSSDKLETCDPQLIALATSALQMTPYDITIVHGWRGEELQNLLHASGASEKPWPESKHNHMIRTPNGLQRAPQSLALDFAPWISNDIPWDDTHIFAVVAGCFFAASRLLDIPIRWGGDFNMNGRTSDQSLLDYGHIELVKPDGA